MSDDNGDTIYLRSSAETAGDIHLITGAGRSETPQFTKPPGSFFFRLGSGEEVLRIEGNGDVFVRGKKITTDQETYEAFRDWVMHARMNHVNTP